MAAPIVQSNTYLGVYDRPWKPSATTTPSAASSRSSLAPISESAAVIAQKNRDLVKQAFGRRNAHFVLTNGVRRHGKAKEVAPYPLSYDMHALDVDTIDHGALWQTRGGPSDFDFKEPPKRSLDLGCGHATWIMDTAKVWKTTHFVGFDLVNVQPDLSQFPELADRIEWVHGNFLTDPLPFENASFDHVYARALEMAVPEDQWDWVISEIVRILKPGGAAEFLFNDIIFPYVALPPEERKLLTKQPPKEPPPPSPIRPEAFPSVAGIPPPGHVNIRSSSKHLTDKARKAFNTMVAEVGNDAPPKPAENGDTSTETEDDSTFSPNASSAGLRSSATSSSMSAPSLKGSSHSDTIQPFDTSQAPPVPPLPPHFQQQPQSSPPPEEEEEAEPPRHLHEWLEDLFYAMFERRFINLTPTRILPNYLNIHLTGVTAGQPVKMPMIKPGTIYGFMEESDVEGGSTTGNTTDEEKKPAAATKEEPAPASETKPPVTKNRNSIQLYAQDSPSPPGPSKPSNPSRASVGSLTVQTNVPVISGPPSASSARLSPNIVINEADSHLDGVPSTSTTSFTTSVSVASSPPSSFSYNAKESAKARGNMGPRPGTGSNDPPPPSFLNLRHRPAANQGEVANMVFDLQEHTLVGTSPAEGIMVDSVATIAGRPRTESGTSGKSVDKSGEPTPPAEDQPPKKKRKKPLKFIARSQALTMMIVRSYKVVLACREDIWEELLLQNRIRNPNEPKDPATRRKMATLRKKFDQAFEHYISDMRDLSAIGDGLVYALGMNRPKRPPSTPSQELDERVSREKRVVKTLGLLGWTYRSQPEPVTYTTTSPDQTRKGSAELRGSIKSAPEKPNVDKVEEEPAYIRSTRVYAGFKRVAKNKTP